MRQWKTMLSSDYTLDNRDKDDLLNKSINYYNEKYNEEKSIKK